MAKSEDGRFGSGVFPRPRAIVEARDAVIEAARAFSRDVMENEGTSDIPDWTQRVIDAVAALERELEIDATRRRAPTGGDDA